ncbi:MAG: Hsp20/alpha crystallin family protein [Chitinispirillaceae bacterium]|nr:Hsp20/alpha crystallin family protein [Chitinispirillaceae bacterium]
MANELEKREKQEVSTSAIEHIQHSGEAYSPDVDIYLSDDEAIFLVDMPGVEKGNVTIQVDEHDSLVIRGKTNYKEPNNKVVMRQYGVGDYYRAFQLTEEYDKEKITAKLGNGLLEIRVPKREEMKPKKIEIKI